MRSDSVDVGVCRGPRESLSEEACVMVRCSWSHGAAKWSGLASPTVCPPGSWNSPWLQRMGACQCRRHKRCGFDSWVWKIPWRRKWQPIPVFLPGEPHGQESLVGYSPWGRKELDMTERLSWHVPHRVLPSEHPDCLCLVIPMSLLSKLGAQGA